jgi:hypothetical protein
VVLSPEYACCAHVATCMQRVLIPTLHICLC